MPRWPPKTEEPFDGTPPDVRPGDLIRYWSTDGRWFDSVAGSAPRYDHRSAIGRHVWLSVLVQYGDRWVNWPAEHVELVERRS